MPKQYKYRTTFSFDGKRYTILADSERELWQKKANKLRDLQEGKVTIGPNMLMRDWIPIALDTYKAGVSKNVLKDMKLRINKHITEEIGYLPIRSVKPIHCQNILNNQIGMSYSHIKKLSQELRFIFQAAVDNQIITRNPAQNLTIPKGTKGTRRSLTEYEEKHFLSVIEDNPRFTLFALMYYCGCRPSEAINAIGKDLSVVDGKPMLHIRGTKTYNSDRSVPVPAAFYQNIANTPPFTPIAPNSRNNAHTEASYDRAVNSLKRAMNISMGAKTYRNALVPPLPLADDFVPYCLRHTYCTNLMKSGVDIRTAQRLMGHASIQMTANIYTHVDQSEILKAAKLMSDFHEAKKSLLASPQI